MAIVARTRRRLCAILPPAVMTLIVLVAACYGAAVSTSDSIPSILAGTDHRSRLLEEKEIRSSITVTLSAWLPETLDVAGAKGPIIKALQLFLCDENGLVVVDNTYNTVCMPPSGADTSFARSNHNGNGAINSRNTNSSSSAEFIEDSLSMVDHDSSYLSSIPISISVSNGHEGGIHWTSWRVTFEVIQIGEIFREQAKLVNVAAAETYLQDVTQLALDVSIMEGIMDSRLNGTSIVMRPMGKELQTFAAAMSHEVQRMVQEDAVDEDEQDDNGNESTPTESDFKEFAIVLRYVGVVMLLISLTVVLLLTHLARRRRLATEQKLSNDERDLEESKGLVTEQGVNRMLDIGRQESEKVLSQGSSSNLVADKSGSTELMSVYLGMKFARAREGRSG